MSKLKKIVFISILLFVLLCIFLVIYTNKSYVGTHVIGSVHAEVMVCSVALLVFVGWVQLMRNQDRKEQKLLVLFLYVFMLGLSIVFMLTRPNYRYADGLTKIKEEFPTVSSFDVEDLDRKERTVPVSNAEEETAKVNGRFYYYVLSQSDEEVYFMMDPYAGDIVELHEQYWGDSGLES